MQTKCPLDVQLSGERKSYEIIAKKTPPQEFAADLGKGGFRLFASSMKFNYVPLHS